MEWRTEAKPKKEIIRYLENLPDEFVWAVVLDSNEPGDRITPVIVGITIFAYSHLAKDVVKRENWFIQNRAKFKKTADGVSATEAAKERAKIEQSHRKRNVRTWVSNNGGKPGRTPGKNRPNQD